MRHAACEMQDARCGLATCDVRHVCTENVARRMVGIIGAGSRVVLRYLAPVVG